MKNFSIPLKNSYHRQVLLSRDIDGNPFGFVPLLCRLYSLCESDIQDLLLDYEDYKITDISNLKDVEDDFLNILNNVGIKELHKQHLPGIGLVVTQECNLCCSHCLASYGTFNVPISEINMTLLKKFLFGHRDLLAKVENVSFFGGEPTLKMDIIEDICRFITEDLDLTANFLLTTNGTGKAEEHLKVWEKYQFKIAVSIDGDEKIHNSSRFDKNKNGSYKKAFSYCETLRKESFPFAVLGVLDHRHYEAGVTMLDNIRFLNSISPVVKVIYVRNLGYAVEGAATLKMNYNRIATETKNAVDAILSKIKSSWINPQDSNWIYENIIFNCIQLISAGIGRPYEHICKASNLTAILPDGTIAPCYLLAHDNEFQLGTLESSNLSLKYSRNKFLNKCTWEELALKGLEIPWYRGVVGDVCFEEIRNSSLDMIKLNPVYNSYQGTMALRVLQHLAALDSNLIEHARLWHAIEVHKNFNMPTKRKHAQKT